MTPFFGKKGAMRTGWDWLLSSCKLEKHPQFCQKQLHCKCDLHHDKSISLMTITKKLFAVHSQICFVSQELPHIHSEDCDSVSLMPNQSNFEKSLLCHPFSFFNYSILVTIETFFSLFVVDEITQSHRPKWRGGGGIGTCVHRDEEHCENVQLGISQHST